VENTILKLNQADEWVNSGFKSLRFYQKLLVEGKKFRLLINDKVHAIKSSSALGHCNCLLLVDLESSQELVLKSSGAGKGYCLSGQPLLSVEHGPKTWPTNISGPAIIRTGTCNFAHFIWNEFDPLLELINRQESLNCYQDVNSIYDLSSLTGLKMVDPKELIQQPSVRLGSMLVTDRVRSYIYNFYGISDQPKASSGRKTLLLGIRGPGKRSLENELEFFSSLLAQLQPLADQIRILLDGITVQNEHSITSEIQSRINSCDHLIRQLTAKAGSIPVVNINGLGFSEWLPLASSVDFYVTHEGTMQHKLAWIFPSKVGICLIGRENAGSIAKWHRNQSHNSSTVHFLPPALFKLGDIPSNRCNERDRIFKIIDINEAARYSVDLIQKQLFARKI